MNPLAKSLRLSFFQSMDRQWLLERILDYGQSAISDRFRSFIQAHEDCFERSLQIGHITGSAWLLNPPKTHVLLTHHKKLGQWLQLGGHSDGDPNTLQVALREAREESGINDIVPLNERIFDLDVHTIPARTLADASVEPEHLHYDVRFLLWCRSSDRITMSDESHDLRWVTPSEIQSLTQDPSVLRLRSKGMAQ